MDKMVKKLMGEVARRSYKDGSQAQMTLVIRDKGATKPSINTSFETVDLEARQSLRRVPFL